MHSSSKQREKQKGIKLSRVYTVRGGPPKWDQCFWCLEMGHRVANCPSRKGGQQARQRSDGTYFKGNGKGGVRDKKSTLQTPQAFQPFCFNVEAKNGNGEWRVDSGCNRHMTPNKRELTDLRPSNVECTFGNNEKLKAVGCGRAQVETTSEKGDKVKILLNDVLYIPGLPQKMLSTGKLCESGGEFLQSTRRNSVLIMPDSETRIPLYRRGYSSLQKRRILMISTPITTSSTNP